MTTLSQLKIDTVYNLSLHAPATLGATRRNVTVIGTSRYDAVQHAEAARKHLAIIAELPAGTERQPNRLPYVKIQAIDGTSEWLALPWISADPEEVQVTGLRITLPGAGAQDVALIQALLRGRGFTQVVVEVL